MEKEKAIKAEIRRLSKVLSKVDESKRTIVKGLIEEAAYMRATLLELKADIDKNGAVSEMQQGSYSITRESPAMKAYTALVSKYAAILKELKSMLPKDSGSEGDALDEFLKK